MSRLKLPPLSLPEQAKVSCDRPSGSARAARTPGGTGGFAFLAFPAICGVTGVATFMIGQDGVVYEFDLGPDTLAIAEAVEIFDSQGWKVAE